MLIFILASSDAGDNEMVRTSKIKSKSGGAVYKLVILSLKLKIFIQKINKTYFVSIL